MRKMLLTVLALAAVACATDDNLMVSPEGGGESASMDSVSSTRVHAYTREYCDARGRDYDPVRLVCVTRPPPTLANADCTADGACEVTNVRVVLEDGHRVISWEAPPDTLRTGTSWLYYVIDGTSGPLYTTALWTTRVTRAPRSGCRDQFEIDTAPRLYIRAGMVPADATGRNRFPSDDLIGARVRARLLPPVEAQECPPPPPPPSRTTRETATVTQPSEPCPSEPQPDGLGERPSSKVLLPQSCESITSGFYPPKTCDSCHGLKTRQA